jgi:hypothetical protein
MRRLDHRVFCYIIETLEIVRPFSGIQAMSRRRTGPVKVLFDFVDHVPTTSDCARAKEALASSAAPIEGSIVMVQLCEGVFLRCRI